MNREKVKAFLERIGCGDIPLESEGCKAVKKDAQTLGTLVRGHLEHVPFENLDVFDFGRIPVLEESELFVKIVEKNRGGYCFELNTLLRCLLKALGYSCYPVAARVLWNKETVPPLAHMGIAAQLEEGMYYCDVGYGGPGPKGLLRLSKGTQIIDGESFQVCHTRDGETRIDRLHDGTWKPLLQFWDKPVRDVDFQVMNYYCATHPDILFTQRRVVNICTSRGSKALMDMELTVRENGRARQSVYKSREELEEGLKKEFGILTKM